METLQVKKTDLGRILETAEILITEVERVLSQEEIIKERLADVKEGKIKGRTEKELNDYLKKRGVKID